MCGRVVTTWSAPRLAAYFGALWSPGPEDDGLDRPRFNVAPTSSLYAVHDTPEGGRRLVPLHWGLVPRWATDTSGASKMINARAESLFERPSYRPLMTRNRCIVPVDGFYEWGPDRQPRYIHDEAGTPLEVAGLWTAWQSPEGASLRSCTLLTTEAVDDLREVHHRMPVALDPDDRDTWLDLEPRHPDEVSRLVEQARRRASARWRWHEVSRAVNSVRSDEASLIEPLPGEPEQGQLFG